MDTLRSVGVHAEALVENVSARGDKAKEIAACVEECVRKKLEDSKALHERLKTKEHLAATSSWTNRYDFELMRKLEREASLLENSFKHEQEKHRKAKEQLATLETAVTQATALQTELEKNVVEDRRRYELFLGLRFGKVKPGEIRFFFNHVDTTDPSREFAFSIRNERRTNRIVDCNPDPGEGYLKISEKLSVGRLTIPQVVFEMRKLFKSLTISQPC